jgi:hypothetical protein
MPTFRLLSPEEVEVVPLIFSFDIAAQHRWNADLAASVSDTGGVIYFLDHSVAFFGFPTLSTAAALKQAADVRRRMEAQYPNGTSLSVSTIGLRRHQHIHANILDHLTDPELSHILWTAIKFKKYDEYLDFIEP